MNKRKAEGARSAPTTTGGIDKRTLFVLAGDFEVVEELAPAARHRLNIKKVNLISSLL
ncbi:hypothetical protein [Ureibacillus chungkukjangi]|uniref:hypothetical protein n=1 Tax=Ureibacillus chungkukjangi TaxID=1202712 RepID=UPI0015E884AF|nr:hypothetical protein [Ureibacillus chungkukjangi]